MCWRNKNYNLCCQVFTNGVNFNERKFDEYKKYLSNCDKKVSFDNICTHIESNSLKWKQNSSFMNSICASVFKYKLREQLDEDTIIAQFCTLYDNRGTQYYTPKEHGEIEIINYQGKHLQNLEKTTRKQQVCTLCEQLR